MPKQKRAANLKELISYFFVASSGVIIQLIVSSITQTRFGFSFENSVTTGYIVAFVFGFFLTKIFAFGKKNSNNSVREGIKFLFVSVFSGIITVKGAYYGKMLFSSLPIFQGEFVLFNKHIDIVELLSHFLGMGLSFVLNFVSHKHFTFKTTGIYEYLIVNFQKISK